MSRRRISFALLILAGLLTLALGVFRFAPLYRLVPHAPRTAAVDALLGARPVVLAHRGASADAPENTLSAFRRAAGLGVGFELDVGLCATGEVIVMHDDTLERTTDGSGSIAAATLAELRQLDAGAWFDEAFAGEPVPTLGEVLDALGGRAVIDIELKTTEQRAALAEAVVAEIERADVVERVFVSSFDPFLLAEVRRRNPAIVRGQLVGSFEGSALAWYEKRALQSLLLNDEARPDLMIVEDEWLSAGWQRAMQARGYRVLVWTVNEPARARALVERGADGVISDVPELARRELSP